MLFEDGATVGIDLGTTFSTVAHLNAVGEPVAIPNDDGELETPSLILLADTGHVVVGPNRTRAAMEDPDNVVQWIKRHMGEADYKRTFDGREITPEFFSALILKKLKKDAEDQIGKIGNAVITVPYYFNDSRRKATQDAGRIAGLNVVDIINEPTAATLAYAWQNGELGKPAASGEWPKRALVYDLGGGTFDVTLVQFTPSHFQVLATDGDVQLGGVDWNERLVEHFIKEFQARHGIDLNGNRSAMQLLRFEADLTKIALSERTSAVMSARVQDKHLSVNITRDQFENLTLDLAQRTLDTTELVVEQANLSFDDIHAVVLVGGSTLMPWVSDRLEGLTGKRPFAGLSPFTTVAQGAAIHAAILEAKFRPGSSLTDRVRRHLAGIKQEDVNSHGLGIAAKNPKDGRVVNHVMIPRNSRLPIERKQTFATNQDNQERVTVKVIEGDAPDPNACSFLGTCRITDLPPGLPKGSPIEVTYAFDTMGRVVVKAKDKVGGREASIQIERRGGLTDTDIDAYLQLADEYTVE